MNDMTTPIALTIAGSDSGGGAGIQADLKTFSALGVYGCSAITALTAQNTLAVTGVHDIPPDFVTAQLDAVFSDLAVDAVKIGMLSNAEIIAAVAASLERYAPAHVVLDPVMVAKSGDDLLQPQAVSALRERLVPMASVITPNLPEAAVLLGRDRDISEDGMREAAAGLIDLGARAVLLKGGHLDGARSKDILFDGTTETVLDAARIASDATHGTGCTLSSALAAYLARGCDLVTAARRAKTYVTDAIRAGGTLQIGAGHGPVHHFHAFWQGKETV